MSVAGQTAEATAALQAGAAPKFTGKKEIHIATAQVHALLAVAAAVQDLAEATRRE